MCVPILQACPGHRLTTQVPFPPLDVPVHMWLDVMNPYTLSHSLLDTTVTLTSCSLIGLGSGTAKQERRSCLFCLTFWQRSNNGWMRCYRLCWYFPIRWPRGMSFHRIRCQIVPNIAAWYSRWSLHVRTAATKLCRCLMLQGWIVGVWFSWISCGSAD